MKLRKTRFTTSISHIIPITKIKHSMYQKQAKIKTTIRHHTEYKSQKCSEGFLGVCKEGITIIYSHNSNWN